MLTMVRKKRTETVVTCRTTVGYNGCKVEVYTLTCGELEVEIWNLGARINTIKWRGTDVTLGFNTPQDYIASQSFAGATIGRVSNRTANGQFSLGGAVYRLTRNEGGNHLHGGNVGFDKRIFTAKPVCNGVAMRLVSEDGEEGYPGRLELEVRFIVTENGVEIRYSAVSDKDTLWGPTSHVYFNLGGEKCRNCLDNMLKINAEEYTPAGSGLIPDGRIEKVRGTPYDFTSFRRVGEGYADSRIAAARGYDTNYVLLCGGPAAEAYCAESGIKLQVYTDMPCIQLYTSGALNACRGKSREYRAGAGFCLEAQYAPNAINIVGFAAPILYAGKRREHYIAYKFSDLNFSQCDTD